MFFSLGAGLKNGWVVVNWSQFFHDVGYIDIDPEKPMNWSELIPDQMD